MKTIYLNGNIHTENPEQPVAKAMVTEEKKFIYVGDEEGAKAIAPDAEIVDLKGKLVIPGLIDGHTHPSVVGETFWHKVIPITYDREELLGYIRKCAEENPKEEVPYLYIENYMTETFGDDGPEKGLLDTIVNDRPARIQDFSDHACWYNSIALEMFKDENGIPHAWSPIGEPEFTKNADGEYTGRCLEATAESDEAIYEALGWRPDIEDKEKIISPFLDMLKKRGITGLMDGITGGDEVMKMFHDMDIEGRLNMFYEATAILSDVADIEDTIATVKKWQKEYATEHVRSNTVKFFADGVNDHGDCLSTEPFHNDPEGKYYGEAYCTMEEIRDVMLRLNEEGIDLHIHCVCDGTYRMICDAVESAQKIVGGEGGYGVEDAWRIRVTMAHCEIIHPDDLPRAQELGIYIDFTPHWSGGYDDEGVQQYHGYERWCTMFDATKLIAAGGRVGFSSDVFNYNEARRADPFLGMQVGMTRVDPDIPLDPERYPGSVHPPYDGKLSVEQLLHGYTAVNAERMRRDDKVGSIEEGKMANFVVMEDDIFNYPAEKMREVQIDSVYFEGEKQ